MKILRLPALILFFVGLGITNIQAQCNIVRYNMNLEHLNAKRNNTIHMPLHVDFTDVFMGVARFEIHIQYNPAMLDFAGINNADAAISGVTASEVEPGRVRLFWARSTFQGIMQTNLVGKLLDIRFDYKGGNTPVTIEDVTIWDIWNNMLMGEHFNGSVDEPPFHAVSLSTDPPGINAVFIGAGQYYVNDMVHIGVEDPLNYRFVNWKNNHANSAVLQNASSRETSFYMTSFDIGVTAYFEKIHNDPVYLTIDMEGSGAVQVGNQVFGKGSGPHTFVFNRGHSVRLLALPESGWDFTHWRNDFQSASMDVNLLMNADKAVTARFSEMKPVLFVEVEGQGQVHAAGKAYGEGAHAITFAQPTQVSLTYQAAEGWKFSHWVYEGLPSGSGSQASVSVQLEPGIVQVKAVFEPIPLPEYTLKVTAIGGGQVFVNGEPYAASLTFTAGTSVTISADPADTWEFDGWEGDSQLGDNKQLTFVIDEDVEITAAFVKTFLLTLLNNSSEEEGMTTGAGRYREGTEVVITSEELERHLFTGWLGSPDDIALLQQPDERFTTLTIPGHDLTLTASYVRLYEVTFELNMTYVDGLHHVLAFQPDNDQVALSTMPVGEGLPGSASQYAVLTPSDADPMIYHYALLLPAGAYSYLYFLESTEENPDWAVEYFRTFSVEEDDILLHDWFGSLSEPVRKFVLQVQAGPNGMIEPAGEIIVEQSGSVLFEITPMEGYHVADVLVDGESLGPLDVLTMEDISGPHVIEVLFALNTYALSYLTDANGSLEGDAAQLVSHGEEGAAVLAVAAEGYLFEAWSDGSTDNPRIDGPIAGDLEVTALFRLKTYSVITAAGPGGAVSVAEILEVNHGDDLYVEITPDTGYHIADVVINGESQGDISIISLTGLAEDQEIVVIFAINQYTVTLTHGDHGSISPGGEVTVEHGGQLSVTITPDSGYHIGEILVDGESFGQDAELLLSSVTKDMQIYVGFALTTYSLSFSVVSSATGEPVHDATITINDMQQPAGDYIITEVVPDTYYYTVSLEGFFPVSGSVVVTSGDETVEVELQVDNTSVDELLTAGLKAYPNPASDILWVEFNNQGVHDVSVVLYNLQGRVMMQMPVYETGDVRVNLNMQTMRPGIYLLHILGSEIPHAGRQIIVK